MRCFKLLGERIMARDFDRQVAELQVRAAVLNRFTRLGTPRAHSTAGNRLVVRYRAKGLSGPVSRRRNRPSNNQVDSEIVQIALTIIRRR
jgi:hypothetical protein